MRKLRVLFLLLLIPALFKANGLLFTLGGEAGLCSIQYERTAESFFVRTGFSIVPGEEAYFSIPLNMGFIWGGRNWKTEFGAGAIYVPGHEREKFIFSVFAGLRRRVSKKLWLRAVISPMIFENDPPLFWGGVGLVYHM